jgi:hypothetical protein
MQVQFNGTASIGASTYEWDFGDGTTNTTSAIPVHTYNVAGLFWVVQLTVTNACGETSVLRASLAQIGIDEEFAEAWLVYPNPAIDQVKLQLPAAMQGEVVVKIINTLGIVVLQQNLKAAEEITLDVAALPQGNYSVEIMRNGFTSRKRLLIQR